MVLHHEFFQMPPQMRPSILPETADVIAPVVVRQIVGLSRNDIGRRFYEVVKGPGGETEPASAGAVSGMSPPK
jgi:hypothetical protein